MPPYPLSLLDFDCRFGSGCVLRTASASISRSSALLFGGSRVKDFCHWVIHSIWGCRGGIKPLLGLPPDSPRLKRAVEPRQSLALKLFQNIDFRFFSRKFLGRRADWR